MAQQVIAPVIPNIGNQEAAVAGSSAVVFTATDRKIIEERGGTIERGRSFIDLLKNQPLTPEVENEETNVKSHQDVTELEGRYREHRRMLKHSVLYNPQERVEINNELPDKYEEPAPVALEPDIEITRVEAAKINEAKKILDETVALVKELNFNPAELFDKLTLEQKELHSLICRVKDLHLKRLLTEKESEFKRLSEEIKAETLQAAKPEARAWLEAQMDKLGRDAAEYKLDLLRSLQSMEFKAQREKAQKWLKKIIRAYEGS
jgi:hypothetical protein